MQRTKFLNRAVAAVQHGLGYLLMFSIDTGPRGPVVLLGTRNPVGRLHAMNACAPLKHPVRVYRTDHFAAILEALGRRFRGQVAGVDAFGARFNVAPRELACAIAEFDLETGKRRPLLEAA